MAFTEARKACIVAKYIRNEFLTVKKRWVHKTVQKTPLSHNIILRWHARFLKDGSMEHKEGNGRPKVTHQNVDYVRLLFENNPRLSTRQAESLLNISRSTI